MTESWNGTAATPEDIAGFRKQLRRGLDEVGGFGDVEVIVAFPFSDDDDTLPAVMKTACHGLVDMGLEQKSLVLCVGPRDRHDQLEAALSRCAPDTGVKALAFTHILGLETHGWTFHAILEVAAQAGAELVVLPPNLDPQDKDGDEPGRGYSRRWIADLLEPIRRDKQDLALARFARHPLVHTVESLFAYPLITEVFGFRVRQPTSHVSAMSPRLVRSCRDAAEDWADHWGLFGFDPWLITHAILEEYSVCEVPLGLASFRRGLGMDRMKPVFRQVAYTLMKQVRENVRTWLNAPEPIVRPAMLGAAMSDIVPPRYAIDTDALFRRFKLEVIHFDNTLLREIRPDDFRRRMEHFADVGPNRSGLGAEEWLEIVNRFLFAYRFETTYHTEDVVDALFPLFLARLWTLTRDLDAIKDRLAEGNHVDAKRAAAIVRREAEDVIEKQADRFAAARVEFRSQWRERRVATMPYLPKIGAWEFVPHVEIVLPQELEKPDGGLVWASHVYQSLLDRYRQEFMHFLDDHLGLAEAADSGTILLKIHDFMVQIDRKLEEQVFTDDLSTIKGAVALARHVVYTFAEAPGFQLTREAASRILTALPPRNLITRLRLKGIANLIERYNPCDALAMAACTEERLYLEQVLDLLEESADPSWFHVDLIRPVVINVEYLSGSFESRSVTPLARLAGRVIAGNTPKGWGGEYHRLTFFLRLVHTTVGVEFHSRLWQEFAEGGNDFRKRLVTSLRNHWGRHVLSAHNLFENRQQRAVAERLHRLADELIRHEASAEAGRLLSAMVDVYHLSITLPDATFVPLSAWTWTSYSYRGGLGTPSPLSSLVERDWATMDFLTEYLERAGLGDEDTINRTVDRMIGEGREPENVSSELLGISVQEPDVIITQTPTARALSSARLERPLERPLLEPIAEHSWESRYVLNAAAVRLDGTIYILYRAFGDDEISRVGLAWTKDGIHIDGRLKKPIFEPAGDDTESKGTEDPRVTVIGHRLYMLYTAYDGEVAQIAMASITRSAFLRHRFGAWKRHGLGFPGLPNKDAVLYPDKFDGHYILYHRIEPNMWISYLDELDCPWPRKGQKIVIGPRSGMMWDGIKLGAGAQPIKTTHGWLNIYHGVDYQRRYRLGVLLMDLEDPSRVIYQSPNPILEPELGYEIGEGEGQRYWVPQVVFTCGAVPAEDREVVGLDDEILVYYGAADTVIGVAKGTLRGMVPILKDI